ncbi:hypothetical protein HMPREF3291_01200 [Bacillus sp. HMSC76G11]|nr:hypothetical protein HMPREF3291_01200 [Bacillus sp. HMSC76G11]
MEGKWKRFKGEAQKQWGNLTHDDYDKAQGNREKMIGKIQKRHGKTIMAGISFYIKNQTMINVCFRLILS